MRIKRSIGIVMLSGIFILGNCASNASKPDPEKLYKKNCKICHGKKGTMTFNGAKKIKDSKMNLKERIEIITNGKNTMTAFKEILSKNEIKSLAEYTIENFKD